MVEDNLLVGGGDDHAEGVKVSTSVLESLLSGDIEDVPELIAETYL